MIKTLFTTLMLCCTSSSATLKYTPRYSANNVYSLNGAYCINQQCISLMRDDFYDNTEYATYTYYDYNNYSSDMADVYCSFYDVGAYKMYNVAVRQFDIYVGYDNPSTYAFQIHLNLGEYTIREWFNKGDYISDLPEDLENCVVYFTQPYYVSKDAYDCFCSCFNANGNDFVTQYTGYYTFTSSNIGTKWFFMGNFMYENTIYNYCDYTYITATDCFASLVGYNDVYGTDFNKNIISNSRFQGSKLLLLDHVLIVNKNKIRMKIHQFDSYEFYFY